MAQKQFTFFHFGAMVKKTRNKGVRLMQTCEQWLVTTLGNWLKFASGDFFTPPGTDLLVYGMGYDSWGVQTQQKAFASAAILAARSKPIRSTPPL